MKWTNQVIQGMAIIVISGAYGRWYFAALHEEPEEDDEDEEDADYDERLSRMDSPIRDSCKRTCRFHIGTIVFGGFIIAAVQFARAILAYVQKQMSGASERNKVSFVPQ